MPAIPAQLTVVIVSSATRDTYDVTRAVESVTLTTSVLDQPGRCEIVYSDTGYAAFSHGSNIVVKAGSSVIFNGYIFKRGIDQTRSQRITAYDSIRYLKNKDSYTFTNSSCAEIYNKIMTLQGLPFKAAGTNTGVKYVKLPAKVFDNTSLYEMLTWACDMHLTLTNQFLMLRSVNNRMELWDLEALTTNLLISDESLLSGFEYESSIDEQTYNVIKLVREETDSGAREVVQKTATNTLPLWGKLQFYDKVKDAMSKAQMEEFASKLLTLYNRVTKTLTLQCIGDFRIQAGSGFALQIRRLTADGLATTPKFVYCTGVTHEIDSSGHTMTIDAVIPQ